MSTTVTYKGSTLTTVDNNTKILETAGTYLEDDITLVDTTASGGLIYQDAEGYVVLDDEAGSGISAITPLSVTENGTYSAPVGTAYSPVTVNVPSPTPSGIKYLYSDVDGEGAWNNISGYEYYSYDYAPIRDNKYRLWVAVNSTNGFTVTTSIYARANKVTIDWGDGTSEYAVASPYLNTHTYLTEGTYCIEVSDPTNNRMKPNDTAMGQSVNSPNTTLVGVELYNTGAGTYPQSCFEYCINLKKVTQINGDLNSYMFSNCYSLERADILNGATSISQRLFQDCHSLRNITIPSSVVSINGYAFYNCKSLNTITIPSGVTSIGSEVFYGCKRLLEIHILPMTPPTIQINTFDNIPSNCIFYVPSASLSAYQTATYWSTYASYMVGE